MNTRKQKACPCLPSTTILVWVSPAYAKGPRRWFVAESWCMSLNFLQTSVFPATVRPSFPFASVLPSAALSPALERTLPPPSLSSKVSASLLSPHWALTGLQVHPAEPGCSGTCH